MYVYIYTLEVGCWLMLVVHYSTFFFPDKKLLRLAPLHLIVHSSGEKLVMHLYKPYSG